MITHDGMIFSQRPNSSMNSFMCVL